MIHSIILDTSLDTLFNSSFSEESVGVLIGVYQADKIFIYSYISFNYIQYIKQDQISKIKSLCLSLCPPYKIVGTYQIVSQPWSSINPVVQTFCSVLNTIESLNPLSSNPNYFYHIYKCIKPSQKQNQSILYDASQKYSISMKVQYKQIVTTFTKCLIDVPFSFSFLSTPLSIQDDMNINFLKQCQYIIQNSTILISSSNKPLSTTLLVSDVEKYQNTTNIQKFTVLYDYQDIQINTLQTSYLICQLLNVLPVYISYPSMLNYTIENIKNVMMESIYQIYLLYQHENHSIYKDWCISGGCISLPIPHYYDYNNILIHSACSKNLMDNIHNSLLKEIDIKTDSKYSSEVNTINNTTFEAQMKEDIHEEEEEKNHENIILTVNSNQSKKTQLNQRTLHQSIKPNISTVYTINNLKSTRNQNKKQNSIFLDPSFYITLGLFLFLLLLFIFYLFIKSRMNV